MEEKLICRDWLPPMERINDSASGEKGSRASIARSAPSRLLDCACTLDCTLARKEKAITIDATLRITQAMDRNSGLRPRRASRRAMRKTHILNNGWVNIRSLNQFLSLYDPRFRSVLSPKSPLPLFSKEGNRNGVLSNRW